MKRINTVKKNLEFNKIISTGKCYKNRHLVLYLLNNDLNRNRFGVSVGTKVGNAVTRNHLKRQLRSIIDNFTFSCPKSKDYIIIVRKSCLEISFEEINKSYKQLIEISMKEKEGESNE